MKGKFILYLLFASLKLSAQKYRYTNITPQNGLAEGIVQNMVQDKYGRIIIRGWETISIYDGQKIKTYDEVNGKTFGFINNLMLNKNGEAIFHNFNGYEFCVTKNKIEIDTSFYALVQKNAVGLNDVFYNEKNERIVVINGIYKQIGNQFEILYKQQNNNNNAITLAGNYILLEQDAELKLIDLVLKKQIAQFQLPHGKYTSFSIENDGSVYYYGKDGIDKLDKNKLSKGILNFEKQIEFKNPPQGYEISKFQLEKNAIWFINAKNGIWSYNLSTKEEKLYSTEDGLIKNPASVFYDNENNFWVSSLTDGIQKIELPQMQQIALPKNIDKNISFVIPQLSKNEVQLFNSKELLISDGKQFKTYPMPNTLNRIKLKWNGEIWEELDEFYFKSTSGKIIDVRERAKLLNKKRDVYQGYCLDKNGNLIIFGNYFIFVPKQGKPLMTSIFYFTDNIVQDDENNYWAFDRANKIGKYKITDTAIVQIGKHLDFKESSIRYTAHWNKDTFVVATRSTGLFFVKIKNDEINILQQISTKNGLSSNFIKTIFLDKEKNIWLGTFTGVNKVIWKNNSVNIERIGLDYNNYSSTELRNVFNDSATLIAFSALGIFTINTTNQSNTANNYKPTVFWSEIKVNDVVIDEINNQQFNYDKNNFEFTCSATSYQNTKSILFHYTLTGNGKKIEQNGNESFFKLSNMEPGNYTLTAMVTFPGNYYAAQTIQYKFKILQPIYLRWWFILGSILLFGLAIFIPIRLFFKNKIQEREAELAKQKATIEQQKAIEIERNRIAADMHDDLGSGLTKITYLSQNTSDKENNLTKIKQTSTQLVESMSEIIWAMKEDNNLLEDLMIYLKTYTKEYCSSNDLTCTINQFENIPSIKVNGQKRRNIYLAIKEILHNIVKHAAAKNVLANFTYQNNNLLIAIADDGKGIYSEEKIETTIGGNGLNNIQKRIATENGNVEIVNNNGTTFNITIPI